MLNPERFQILLNNYVTDIASSPERGELFVMVRSGEYQGWLDQHINGTLQAKLAEGPSLSVAEQDKMLQKVFSYSEPVTPVIVMKRRPRYIKWAAAAVLMVAVGGAYTWFHHPAGQQVAAIQPAKQDIVVPGGYKATLELADASILNLEGTQSGVLPRQGNTELSMAEAGQLEYKSQGSDKEILYNKITTPRGGQYKLVLPDGSKVWLNAASSLRFPIAFAGDERSVLLTGEAYFEINPHPVPGDPGKKIPFTVNVNGVKVNVLGTHFNVMAYTDEPALQTTLLEGSVKVSNGDASGLLKPGQQAQVTGGQVKVVSTDVSTAVAWKNGNFDFGPGGADVKAVMRQVSRWYDVDIAYASSVPQKMFEGKIARDEKIADLVKILETNDIHVRLDEKGRKLVVMP
jgi:ferric-dicitrate binding protein FerR (iron transport regulator)